MAVNVDTVYQTVQALANKEQRGYLTPQEFNLFANQAQQDIYEQYLYDLAAMREARPEQRELGDSIRHILYKIENGGGNITFNTAGSGTDIPINLHTGRIFVTVGGDRRTARRIENIDEIYDLRASKWHQEAFDEIVYFEDGVGQIQVHSGTGPITSGVEYEVISGRPGLVNWGYVIINETPLYDPASSENFDLDISEQTELVAKILKLAGVSMEDQEVYQAGQTEEALITQKENK